MKARAKISVWFKGLFRLKQLAVLRVTLGREGQHQYSAYLLELEAEQVKAGAEQGPLKDIGHFGKSFPKVPVLLCLNGKGVLGKTIPAADLTSEAALAQALPGADPGDFYVQSLKVYNGTQPETRLEVIRKPLADELSAQLEAAGYPVVGLCLGEDAGLRDNAAKVLLGAGGVTAAAPPMQERLLQLRAKARLSGVFALTGVGLLLLLLLNFLLLSHYTAEVEQLALQQNLKGSEVKKYALLETELSSRAAFLRTSGFSGYRFAWLTGAVMASRPAGVIVTEFSINPLKQQAFASGGRKVYDAGKMIIRGQSEGAAEVNGWLYGLRAMDWVKHCELSGYVVSRDTGKGEFTVAIEMRPYREQQHQE